nr:hypothetical protein B0A51_05046 [Rachicladosporium sp. CCFEE 5018]
MASDTGKDHKAVQRDIPDRYSVFLNTEKWCIASLVAYASFFSTLSSFIYFPAIPAISGALSVSVDQINWTVTAYMAVASVGPTLTGNISDVYGRRPVYIVVLSLYIAANVGIAVAHSYPVLLALRAVQALAISGTFSITYGVIADIASPAERGSFVSLVAFATTVAPAFGPMLGGALTYAAGWTWIFWFLSLSSGLCLLLMVFVLPETARNVVGNGSTKPPKLSQLPINLSAFRHWNGTDCNGDGSPEAEKKSLWRVLNPLQSLTILIRRDNLVIVSACSLLYVVYTCVNTSLSVLFVEIYNLNQWQAGLVYLPFGIGGLASSLFSGRMINKAYRKTRIDLETSIEGAASAELNDFPVERARLRVIWIPLLITIYNTLLVDKNPRNPAAAQASSNILRCGFAAIVIAFLEVAFTGIGIGWTFTIMSALCLICLALFAVDYAWGFAWRQLALAAKAGDTRVL